jgi:type III pantothenate kinase
MVWKLLALDVGNSRVKWGLFEGEELVETAACRVDEPHVAVERLEQWRVMEGPECVVAVASVNPTASERIVSQLPADRVVQIEGYQQLPLEVLVDRPSAVGIDRLLNAVAANLRRPPGKAALIVDLGSAVTVDLVDAAGSFQGGAILPGLRSAGRALHQFTYWLPDVSVTRAPEPLGKNTVAAIESGLFWGMIGAVKELIHRMSQAYPEESCVYVTGGDAALLAGYLDLAYVLWPHMTLYGIYAAAHHILARW